MQLKVLWAIIQSRSNQILAILVFSSVIFILITLVLSQYEIINAKKNAKYTVAYITSDWHQKNNKGVGTDFKYFVNGVKIEKTFSYRLDKGKKYIVLYDSISPRNYIMLFNHQLSGEIKAPVNGWNFEEIPIKLDSADLKFYFEDLKL